jgi:hypothetical protein
MSPHPMGLTPLASTLGLIIAAAVGVGPNRVDAQTGSLQGKVADSRGSAISGVEVRLVGSSARATTDESGLFKLKLKAGTHRLSFRRVGFAPAADSVTMSDDAVVERRFVMVENVMALDPVTVERPLSIAMRRFEDRRKTQQGSFIDWTELKKDETKGLRSVLARRLPGVRFVSYRGALYAASSRGSSQMDRRTLIRAVIADPRSPAACYLQVFLDGSRLYAPDGYSDAINLSDFQTRDMEAVEFYSGTANTPSEFSSSYATCGTLVFWTRLP